MNGNRFGHRLALNLVGGRAVIFMENWKNDGELGRTILRKQNRLSVHVYCTGLLFHTDFLACLSLLQSRPLLAFFPSSSFLIGYAEWTLPFLFTACAKSTWLLQISISLKLDLNQLTNLDHKIIKIILLLTFKIKCQKWINKMHKIHLFNYTIFIL